jgi:aerobic carbon-monoxide dehydrogenase small subunit
MNGADTMTVAFSLNGETRRVQAAADSRLIDLLRDEFSLTSAKKACGIGRCGSCTVLLGELPANACLLMLWQLDGRDITTPEGLDALPEAETIRAALATENAFQCGYCAPGFSVVLTALLRENPQAGEADIRAALDGSICRCTGYHSIIRGALAAAEALRNMRASTGATP